MVVTDMRPLSSLEELVFCVRALNVPLSRGLKTIEGKQ